MGHPFRMGLGNNQLRKALLASTALIAFAAPQAASAACQGENTGNVLCDAAHLAGKDVVRYAW